jgi:hypothetical protein
MTRSTRVFAVGATAVLVAVVLAACGGGGSTSSSTTSSSSTAAANAAPAGTGSTAGPAAFATRRSALLACLSKHGVTLPTGLGGRRFGATGATGAFPRFGATGARRFFGATGARRFFGATGAAGATGTAFPPGGFAGGAGRAGAGGFLGSANPKLAKALQECGGFGGFAGGGFAGGRFGATGPAGVNSVSNPAYRARIVSYAACMKADGITLPKPNFSGSGFVFGTKVNRTSSAFTAANAKCTPLLAVPPVPAG